MMSNSQAQGVGFSFAAGPPPLQNFAAPSTYFSQQFQAQPFFSTDNFVGASIWQGDISGGVFSSQPALNYGGHCTFPAMPNAFVREMYDNLEPVDDSMDAQIGWQATDGASWLDQGAMNAYLAARDQVTSTQPGLGVGW
jgi:hypothetical protein